MDPLSGKIIDNFSFTVYVDAEEFLFLKDLECF
jgi:hypothetical protein